MKATAIAPANIALIKYWGKKDIALRIPLNDSISMNIDGATTITTVEFSDTFHQDDISFIGETISDKEKKRIADHVERIRHYAHKTLFARVVTQNSFPKGTGIASSASGFAALTLAGTRAIGISLNEKELTMLARIGSGSACRSIPDGFVLWKTGETSKQSFATSIFPPSYWRLVDVIAVVSKDGKKISSTDGMDKIKTSPYLKERIQQIPGRITRLLQAFKDKNFTVFGEVIEEECLDMHHVMQTQNPPLLYWNEVTKQIMKAVIDWRSQGLWVYFTIDAGPNVHCICDEKDAHIVKDRLQLINGVQSVISNRVTTGARCIDTHLF